MQPSRANARSVLNNDYHQNNITTAAEISTTPKTSPKVTVFPSRPPAHVEQQKRQRLQRQKEISHNLYQRSTSESLPDEAGGGSSSLVEIDINNINRISNNITKFSNKSSSTDSDQVGQHGGASVTSTNHKRRPLLQRQQRQSSEDTEVSSLRGNVHFKEDPEYFEAVLQKNARGQAEQRSSSSVITANAAPDGTVGGGSSSTYVPAVSVVKNNIVSGGVDQIKIPSNQLQQPNYKSTVTSSTNFRQNRSQQDQVPTSYHHAVSSNHLNYSGGTPHNFLSHSYTPSSTYACAVERSSSYKNHNSNIINKQSDHSNHQPINGYPGVLIPAASPVLGKRNNISMVHHNQSDPASTTSIVPAPAEILLGLSPTLEHQQNTSKTNYHQLKRALPTTIESFPDEVKFHAETVGTVNLEAGCTSSRLLRKPQQNPHELLAGGRRAPASSSSTTTTRGCWHQEDKEDGNLVLRWPRTRLPDPCETPTQPQKTHQNLLKNNVTALNHSAAAGHSGNNILNSPLASAAAVATASCTSTAAASSYSAATANHVGPQRLLPYVPKRFVVPRVSAKELLHSKDSRANALGHAQHHHHRALFDTTEHQEEDENNAVTHLGGLQSDTNGNGDNPTDEEDHLPAADLIDVIGPAPDNNPAFKSPLEGAGPVACNIGKNNVVSVTNMVMNSNDHDDDYGDLIANEVIPDTYSSLQRGPRSRGHRSSGGGGGGYDHHNSVYGTYRRGGPRGHHGGGSGLNSSSHNEYNNFASSFEDEFDLKHFQQSLKSDLDSSPAAYQPPSQSQPRGLQHHAASRSTSEPNRVQSQNLPSGSTYLPNHASSSSSVLDHSNAVNKSNVISQRNDHINSTYPSISSTSITYPTSQKYSTYNQDEYNADYSVNLPPTSTGVASSDLEFPETPAYSSTNVVRGGAFQDNHQGYLPSSSFDDPSSSSFELPRNPPTASTLQPNGDLGHNLRGGSSNLYSRSHRDSTRGIYDQTQELSAVYSNDIGVVNSMPDQNLAPPELVNHYHSPSTVVQHPPPSTNRQYGDLADNTGRSPPPIQSGNHSRNPIQKSVGWAEELQESYSETPYQESTSDLLTENSFGMMGVDYAQHEQQQQHHHQQQQQQQQQQPGYGNSFEPEDDEKITVSYYDQQGVMQTYTYGQAIADIDQHFLVDGTDYFNVWERIKDHNWIPKLLDCQNYQEEIFSEDGEDPNEMCCKHLQLLKETANSGSFLLPNKNWALKMIDSAGKLPDGVLAGRGPPMGNMKECKDIEVSNPRYDGEQLDSFVGAYFYMFHSIKKVGDEIDTNSNERGIIIDPILRPSVIPPDLAFTISAQGFRLQYGICVPSSCSREFLGKVIEETVNYTLIYENQKYKLGAEALGPRMKDRKKPDFDGSDIAFLSLNAVLLTLILIGTLLEAWRIYALKQNKWTDSNYSKFLINFSLYSNTKKLFDLKIPNSVDHISCLDGIRFLSMTWVVMGHTMQSIVFGTFSVSNGGFAKLYESFWFQGVTNAFASVDTFFLISGCLVTYLMLKELDKYKGRINFPLMYIHRYLRLTGTYAYLIFFFATVYRYMDFGPRHYQFFSPGAECRKSPWRQLLYINNWYAENSGGCIGQTWYLADDMQYFLITPPLVYILWKWNIVGLILSGVLTLTSVIVPTALHYKYAWQATPSIMAPDHVISCGDTPQVDDADYMEWGYIKPWNRYSPYIVGVLLGYLLHVTKRKQFKLSKLINIWMWIVAFCLGFAVVYGLDMPNHSRCEDRLSNLAQSIYAGFYAFVWALAVSWVIFACTRGYGGWINQLLSWKAFIPFSRISYIIYLVHMELNTFMFNFYEATLPMNVTVVVLIYLSMLGFDCILSAVLFIFVEMPWLNTEKFVVGLLLAPKKPKKI